MNGLPMTRLQRVVLSVALCTLSLACGESGDGDVELGPSTGGCPDIGGSMVRMPEGFCMDRTEVTRGAYFSWLESEPGVDTQSTACESNDDYLPTCLTTGGWGLDRYLENPVGCVDWCDAKAFCEAHEKRLCGAIDGGPSPMDDYDNAASNEWFAACSGGGENDYVYGDAYQAHECYESPVEGWGSTEVARLAGCTSPSSEHTGVYDLGGNVAEWEDSCDAENDIARCRIRGGSFKHNANGIRCDAGSTLSLSRLSTDDAVGFRCCAN